MQVSFEVFDKRMKFEKNHYHYDISRGALSK